MASFLRHGGVLLTAIVLAAAFAVFEITSRAATPIVKGCEWALGRAATGLESPPLVRSPEDIKAAALAERPSLKIAALLAEQAGAAERLSGLNRRPDITAGLFVPSKRISAWGFSLGLTSVSSLTGLM